MKKKLATILFSIIVISMACGVYMPAFSVHAFSADMNENHEVNVHDCCDNEDAASDCYQSIEKMKSMDGFDISFSDKGILWNSIGLDTYNIDINNIQHYIGWNVVYDIEKTLAYSKQLRSQRLLA